MTITTRLDALERRQPRALADRWGGGPYHKEPPSPAWRAAFERTFTEMWADWTTGWTEEEAQAEQQRWNAAWRTGSYR